MKQERKKRINSPIYLFDTYQREKRQFVPLEQGKVKIYTCGPTVYDYPHIGNLRAYIFADTLRKMFEFNGYEVRHVINITDVGHLTSDADSGEDKIELSARKQKLSASEIAEFYTKIFKQNLLDLGVEPPTIWSKATDHISEQIALIQKLEKRGYTYLTSDGIYFDTSRLSNYGYLARLDVKGIKPGARVDLGEKRNPTDFALWKFSSKDKKRQMEWPSPWGIGFPGWHIECSAMAMKYLGETIDIHTGGIDHIPVHHTNEIAQSEAATGKQFARYWLHVAFLTSHGKKMAKSEGNFITLQDIVQKGYDPLTFRYYALTSHYRSSLNFTWQGLQGIQKAIMSLREKVLSWGSSHGTPDEKFLKEFRIRINNDLNTPQTIALLWEVVDSSLAPEKKRATLMAFDKVLGLGLTHSSTGEIPEEVRILVQKREFLRKNGQWKDSDRLRQKILEKGYEVRDTSTGPKVVRKGL
ncbi:MAG TPA: cysteine--tRNA ligase [Candidatus Paceibacterota bacterium]|nr:cysteine--tRNA ligase [Candidatus Paceibacterota bacterium]HPC37310.1 cysteine--tRNA ligase [Candidatus Paceibacterota bacterium]